MVERTEVAREARRVAQQVVAHAEADSRRLRHEAEDYIDQKLAAFEVVLERTMQTVLRGREQLQAVVAPLPADARSARTRPARSNPASTTKTTSKAQNRHPAGKPTRLLSSRAGLRTGTRSGRGRRTRPCSRVAPRTGTGRRVSLSTKMPHSGAAHMSELRIDVADLLTHPGARRRLHWRRRSTASGAAPRASIEPGARSISSLERVPDGVVARGTFTAHWDADCGTCLRGLDAELDVAVAELFEHHPVDGETYPLEGHEIDLEQLVRDALLLELPARAPACAAMRARPMPTRRPGMLTGDPPTPMPTPTQLLPTPAGPRCPSSISDPDHPASSEEHPMAVPKRKTPRAKTRQRRASNWRLGTPARSTCPNCGAVKQPHIVCSNCGWYAGRQVIDVD